MWPGVSSHSRSTFSVSYCTQQGGTRVGDDLASSNVNRTASLAATSIAIFTFMLIFLYPRFASGEINSALFQVTLGVIGVATFSFVFASFLLLRLIAPCMVGGSRASPLLPKGRSLLAAGAHASVPGPELDPGSRSASSSWLQSGWRPGSSMCCSRSGLSGSTAEDELRLSRRRLPDFTGRVLVE